MSFFGNFSLGGLLNRQLVVNSTVEEECNGENSTFLGVNNCTFISGLGFEDYGGLNAANSNGWIMSLGSVMKHYDEGQMYMKIYKKGRDCERMMKHVLIGILSSERRRNNSVTVNYHDLT